MVLVEVGAVISRVTNNENDAMDAVKKVWTHANYIFFDYELLELTIPTEIKTKASGFDNLIISCAILSDSAIITDDLKLHEIAHEYWYESYLLRELEYLHISSDGFMNYIFCVDHQSK